MIDHKHFLLQIIFQAEVGEVGQSDIAIDTIKIKPGACPSNPKIVLYNNYIPFFTEMKLYDNTAEDIVNTWK